MVLNNNTFGRNEPFHNFIFNRLSIIDLSKKASQPMVSDQFNTLIMFNGEIYNHRELRKNLESYKINFKSSHSDTETLLNGLSYLGFDFLNDVNGQFSIFFQNIEKNEYFLIRDRAGQKPLYYSYNNDQLFFGSDLKSVSKLSNNFSINNDQIVNYLNFGTTINPNTFFENVQAVLPGECIKFSFNSNQQIIKNGFKYWELSKFLDEKRFKDEEFISLFEDSVWKRLESDVPISSFVSGGLDSTAVVKALSKKSNNLNTFSMVTDSKIYDETDYMKQVVDKYKTKHSIEVINSSVNFEEIKSIVLSFDDIIYDPSIIPTYILSKNISKNYKVALSGDGGDELLSGYEHYKNFTSNKNFPSKFSNALFSVYPGYFGSGNSILKNSSEWKSAFSSYYSDRKLLGLLRIDDFESFEEIFLENKEKNWKSLMLTDHKFFLNEMMLKKIDRSSMINSLEIRSPFVDHKLIEYVFSTNMSFHNIDNPKQLLKNKLSHDFSKEFLNRKKMGFVFDLENWIYENKEEILSIINKLDFIDLFNVKKLFLFKSRINSLRIFKLLVISEFIEDYT
ncbi:MAG: asparagine synthase (glutamine-hydrolyzing), partial [Flavobacteriaceae bacterium]